MFPETIIHEILRLTLVFMRTSALNEKLISVFQFGMDTVWALVYLSMEF